MNERRKQIPWMDVGIILLAVVLRLVLLDIKPPHFDEGVNGWFADQMTRNGYYHYDPTNYHGPLHFYAVFLSQTLFGRNLWALRLPAIIAGLLAVWALLRFREFFGPTTARVAALAMAVSPAAVFYGRYSIHESWQVFFSILLLWGLIGLWQKGERRFLFAAVTGFTGMVLTKETYLLHGGCFLLAAPVLWIWQKVVPSKPALPIARQEWTAGDLAWAVGAGVFAIVFFYSGTFLDFPGLRGLYETFAAWFHTGHDAAGHAKPAYSLFGISWLNSYWLALFARYEYPALAGFIVAILCAAPSDARLRYIAISGGGVLFAYSIIPYKTPWCIISILWPFFLLFGAGVAWAAARWKLPTIAATLVLLIASLVSTIRLNFFHFTDEKEPYVYVQTYADIKTLTEPLLALARMDARFYHVNGELILDSYYPLPWILGDFTHVGYYADNPPTEFNGDFIVTGVSKAPEIEAKLKDVYLKREFRLRDAQEKCVVYFRKSIYGGYLENEPPIVGTRR